MQAVRIWLDQTTNPNCPGRVWLRSMGEFECPYCGTIRILRLKKGREQGSCGCMSGGPTHRLVNHPTYNTWKSMKARCYNPQATGYQNYGGRGISVCPSWLHSFAAFHHWAITHGWQQGLTVERINNNRNYSPRNCKWVPRGKQSRNRRMNKLNEIKVAVIRGRYLSSERQARLAEAFTVSPGTIYDIVHNRTWKGVTPCLT